MLRVGFVFFAGFLSALALIAAEFAVVTTGMKVVVAHRDDPDVVLLCGLGIAAATGFLILAWYRVTTGDAFYRVVKTVADRLPA